MRDERFEFFIEELGEANTSRPVPAERLQKYRHVLPPSLLTIWQDEGWCSYADGLFWTTDPDEYTHLAAAWTAGTPLETVDRYHVIARTAFGKLYLWGEKLNRSVTIDCSAGFILALADKLRVPAPDADNSLLSVFSTMDRPVCDVEDSNGEFLFERARARLGQLDHTQMYGFEPALSIGGRLRLENLNKVSLDVHLTILREFAAPVMPNVSMPKG